MKRLLIFGAVGLLGLSALTACGDDKGSKSTTTNVKTENTAFCQDLVAYNGAVQALDALDPATATKSDYSAAADAVKAAGQTLVDSAKSLSQTEVTNLQTQIDALKGSLKDAPDDVSVSTILAEAKTQAAKVAASSAIVNTAICTPANSTTTTKA